MSQFYVCPRLQPTQPKRNTHFPQPQIRSSSPSRSRSRTSFPSLSQSPVQQSPTHSPTTTTTTSDNDDDDDSLPFPAPLPRSDFLVEDFTPQTYLTTLTSRHQTLEDLRADLRTRSQQLNTELLDLVNGCYEEFLSLGGSVRGGEEKVEGLRVGLAGVGREISGLQGLVSEREAVVQRLVRERRVMRGEIAQGRGLMLWEGRVAALERGLMIDGVGSGGAGKGAESSEEEESLDFENEEDEGDVLGLARLKARVAEFMAVQRMAGRLGRGHPLIVANGERVARVRNTLLLDLGTALRQGRVEKMQGDGAVVEIMKLYRDLDAGKEAVRVLQGLKKR